MDNDRMKKEEYIETLVYSQYPCVTLMLGTAFLVEVLD